MKIVCGFTPSTRVALNFVTDMTVVEALMYVMRDYYTDYTITNTFDVSPVEQRKWVAAGNKSILRKQTLKGLDDE